MREAEQAPACFLCGRHLYGEKSETPATVSFLDKSAVCRPRGKRGRVHHPTFARVSRGFPPFLSTLVEDRHLQTTHFLSE